MILLPSLPQPEERGEEEYLDTYILHINTLHHSHVIKKDRKPKKTRKEVMVLIR